MCSADLNLKPHLMRRTLLVIGFALGCWLLPLWRALREAKTETASAEKMAMRNETGKRPLILYAESWPTRRKLDLKEIQGITNESESSLSPQNVSENLYSELSRLGITAEIHRIDQLPETLDLRAHSPLVLVYSARHGLPSAGAITAIDRIVEPFIARNGGPAGLRLTDMPIGESTESNQAAQKHMLSMSAYYELPYRSGPGLNPDLSLREERKAIAAQAALIGKELAR